MIAEFSIIPVGKGESIGKDVAKAIKLVVDSGMPYRVTPMATIVEGSSDEIFSLLKKCHDFMMLDNTRVYTRIVIDDRKETTSAIEKKVRSVEKHLGQNVNR